MHTDTPNTETADATSDAFTVHDVARLFGLKESRLRYWAQTGFISPTGKMNLDTQDRDRRCYAFSDLVEIKAAKGLLNHGIPLQRVRRSLTALRQAMPNELRLISRMRVCSDGETILVYDGATAIDPLSGQTLLDFEVHALGQEISRILRLPLAELCGPPGVPARDRSTTDERTSLENAQAGRRGDTSVSGHWPADENNGSPTAFGWLKRAMTLDEDPTREKEAIAAYSEAITLDPGLAVAHTNLGNLYYRKGNRAAALRCYETACTLDPDQPQAHYNLANINAEEGDPDMAIAEYRHALRLSASFPDAHFNLALALEQVGSRRQAMTHWRHYLELQSGELESGDEWYAEAKQHLERLQRSDGPTADVRS